jgi:hypothetical protein
MWYIVIPAAGAVGAAFAWWGIKRGAFGDKLVLYDPAVSEAARVAREEVPTTWYKYPVQSGQDVLAATSQHSRISRLIIVSHGAPDWMINPTTGITLRGLGLAPAGLARALRWRLVTGAVIGLAGCSAARSYSEAGVWGPEAFGPGGAQSLAGAIRDAIAANGIHLGVEVRGHTLSGGVTANPSARTCRVGRPGAPCASVMQEAGETDWQRWVNTFYGERAQRWVLGL